MSQRGIAGLARVLSILVVLLITVMGPAASAANDSHYLIVPCGGEHHEPVLMRIERDKIASTQPLGQTVGYEATDGPVFTTLTSKPTKGSTEIQWDVASGKQRSVRDSSVYVPRALMEGPRPQIVFDDARNRRVFVSMSVAISRPDAFLGLCLIEPDGAEKHIDAPTALYLVKAPGGAIAWGPESKVRFFDFATGQLTVGPELRKGEQCLWVPGNGLVAWNPIGQLRWLADDHMSFLPQEKQSITPLNVSVIDVQVCSWKGSPAIAAAVLNGGEGLLSTSRTLRVTDIEGNLLAEQKMPFDFYNFHAGKLPEDPMLFITSAGEFATFDSGRAAKIALPQMPPWARVYTRILR